MASVFATRRGPNCKLAETAISPWRLAKFRAIRTKSKSKARRSAGLQDDESNKDFISACRILRDGICRNMNRQQLPIRTACLREQYSRQRQEEYAEEQRWRWNKVKEKCGRRETRRLHVAKRDISFRSVHVRLSFLDSRVLCVLFTFVVSGAFRLGSEYICRAPEISVPPTCVFHGTARERERGWMRILSSKMSLQFNEAVLGRKMLVKKFRHIEFMDWICKYRGDDLSWYVYVFAHAALFMSRFTLELVSPRISTCNRFTIAIYHENIDSVLRITNLRKHREGMNLQD